MSQAGRFVTGGGGGSGTVISLTGNSGGPVNPDAFGNIDLLGSGVITVAGDPITNTLTISLAGSVATEYDADAGTATPALGILNIDGGTGIQTSGSGNTILIDLIVPVSIADGGTNATSMTNTDGVVYFDGTRLVTTTVGTAGQLLTSNGAGNAPTFQNVPSTGVISITGDTGSAISGALTITGSTSGASFDTTGTTITESFNYLNMPYTNAGGTQGVIKFGGIPIFGFYGGAGQFNTFLGDVSGNLSLTGTNNIAYGPATLTHVTSGFANVAIGPLALTTCTTGNSNIAMGLDALQHLTSGTGNVAVGNQPLQSLLTGTDNVAFGISAGSNYTGAESNNILISNPGVVAESNVIRIGVEATQTDAYIAGIYSEAVGATNGLVYCDNTGKLGTTGGTFPSLGTTNHAVQVGNSLGGLTSLPLGTNGQVLLGATGADPAFASLTSSSGTITYTTGASTLSIDVTAPLVISSGGTNAISMTNTDGVVYFDGTKLNTTTVGTVGQVLTSNGVGVAPTYQTPAAGGVTSITGNSGTATPSAGVIQIAGGNNITTSGATNVLTVNVSGTTNHAVQVGNLTGSLTSLTAGTNGQVLLGSTGVDPVFATLTSSGSSITYTTGAGTLNLDLTSPVSIAHGGTNATSMSNTFGVNYYDGTRLVTTTVGTAGQILTSNGAGVAPTFQTASVSGVTSITGDSGGALAGAISITGGSSGAVYTGSGGNILTTTFTNLVMADTTATTGYIQIGTQKVLAAWGGVAQNNIFVGEGSGNATLAGNKNTGVGAGSLAALTGGASAGYINVAVGYNALKACTIGSANIAIGSIALSTLTTGINNVAVGDASLPNLLTGGNNVAIGELAGNAYIGAESSNILILSPGVSSESNTIRIGTQGSGSGQQNAAYMAGITGSTVGGTNAIVYCDNTGKLGTAGGTFPSLGTTNHAVQVGNSSGGLTSLSVGTNGQVLLGSTGANPVFATLTSTGSSISYTTGAGTLNLDLTSPVSIAYGGTNATSMTTTDGTIYYDGTRLVTTTTGTSGQVLTSNGAGVAPTYQSLAGGGVTSITGDTGGAITGALNLTGGSSGALFNTTGSNITESFQFLAMSDSTSTTGYISIGGSKVLAAWPGVASSNIFVGQSAGLSSTTSTSSTAVGASALGAITSGINNTAVGTSALAAATTTTNNVALGTSALTAATTGNGSNVAVGFAALNKITTGVSNIGIGKSAGTNYGGTEGSNILINNAGVASESNTIHIGTQGSSAGQQNACYVAGITGATVGATNGLVYCDNTGKLGTGGAIYESSHYSTTQAIGSSSLTAVKFDTDDTSVGGITHPDISGGVWTQFAAPTGGGGLYMVSASVNWATFGGASTNAQLYFQVNGVTTIRYAEVLYTSGSNANRNNLSALIFLNAGDYVQLFLSQNTGSSVNIGSGTSTFYNRFQIARLM